MRRTVPISPLQRARLATLHDVLQHAQKALDLFCDAILTGVDIDTANVVDLTADGLVIEVPDGSPVPEVHE